VIGEIGAEMEGVEGEEEGGDEEEDGLEDLENAGRAGVRLVHLLRGLNAGWWYEFQSITEVLLRARFAGKRAGGEAIRHGCRCYSFLSNQ